MDNVLGAKGRNSPPALPPIQADRRKDRIREPSGFQLDFNRVGWADASGAQSPLPAFGVNRQVSYFIS